MQSRITCPNCGDHTIIRGKAEYGGGWLCFKKFGGCGTRFPEDEPGIVTQVEQLPPLPAKPAALPAQTARPAVSVATDAYRKDIIERLTRLEGKIDRLLPMATESEVF